MTVDEAIETLRYEIDEECHCEYIADEIHFLIETVENQRLQLRELKLKGGECIVRERETDENEFCSYGERRDT